MAVVTYSVQYKFVHPITRNPITNKQSGYEGYGSVIEQGKGLASPPGFTGTWVSDQTRVSPLMFGANETGISKFPNYITDLTGFDPVTQQLQEDVQQLEEEIAELTKEKEEELAKRNAARLVLQSHHESGVSIPTNDTSTLTFPSTATSGTLASMSNGSKNGCSVVDGGWSGRGSSRICSWTHAQSCMDALSDFNSAGSRIAAINSAVPPLQSTLDAQRILFDNRIGRVAPQAEKSFIVDRNYPDSIMYDMLFMFDTTRMAYSREFLFSGGTTSNPREMQIEINVDTFKQIKGDPWFTISQHGSLQAAMNAASPLIKRLGKNNVQVVKNVPLDLTVHIE